MHELAITQSVVAGVAGRIGDARATRVVLEIGRLSGVVPGAIAFCFDLCTRGTALEGAALEIVEIPARARCRACAAEAVIDDPLAACGCGSVDLEVVSGQELRIKEVEVI